ncbi:MAG: cysteine synthase family protein [Syntrophobacterales bacterium]|nr:cysteine synthase family protein [Syntrophobacterales bacterium]
MHKNILETIGKTPLVAINRLNPNPKSVNIYAKIEGVNPGGSVKDRIALRMIEQAGKSGELTKEKIIIEPTSGNTGIAIAMIGAIKGYQVEIVMSDAVSVERRKMIAAFGAKITLTPGKKGTDGAILKARELVKQYPEKYFMPDQFSNEYNKAAHYETTAQEIHDQLGGQVDYFVASIGTSGTLMGVGAGLRKFCSPDVKIVSAEPTLGHYIQGLKNMEEAIVPAIYDKAKLDQIIQVETEAAFAMAREIIKQEGIFVGMSSGAAMVATLEVAKKVKRTPGKKINIVTLFPDRGEKYLSTKLFE